MAVRMLIRESEGGSVQLDMQCLLEGFQEPAVFCRDGTIRYFNEPFLALFPDTRKGDQLPNRFWERDFLYSIEISQTEAGSLYLLRPRREDGNWEDLVELSQQMRRCLSFLMAAEEKISSKLEKTDREGRQIMAEVGRNLYRLRRLSEHAELLSRLMEENTPVYRESPMELVSLCRELGDRMESLAALNGVAFSLLCKEDYVMTVGDPDLFQRMLLQLCSDAMQSVKEGGHFGIEVERRDGRAILTVWDDGAGTEELRLAGFGRRRSRRGGVPRPVDEEDFGQRIVRETISIHQGVVMANARPGGGLQVKISLPLKRHWRGLLRSTPEWGITLEERILIELSEVLPASLYGDDSQEW